MLVGSPLIQEPDRPFSAISRQLIMDSPVACKMKYEIENYYPIWRSGIRVFETTAVEGPSAVSPGCPSQPANVLDEDSPPCYRSEFMEMGEKNFLRRDRYRVMSFQAALHASKRKFQSDTIVEHLLNGGSISLEELQGNEVVGLMGDSGLIWMDPVTRSSSVPSKHVRGLLRELLVVRRSSILSGLFGRLAGGS